METELLSLYINEQYYDNKIKYRIRTIYIIFREKAATLISFSVKVFLLKFIVMLFFLLPFHFNLDNPTREGGKKRKKENYRVITGNYVSVIEARLILDPNRCRRRTSTCSPIVS